MNIKIIVDSGADLPLEIAQKYNIDILPLSVNLEGKEYLDGVSILSKDLYENMRKGSVYKTAQIPFQTFKESFIKYARLGQQCIYIAFSSGLSGTYHTAIMAKNEILEEYPDFDLDIIDTKAASFGCGLIAYYAAQMIEKGKNKEEVVEAIHFYANHMQHIFTVDSLEYLFRGGRVSRTSAIVGGLLNIKPILHVEDGKLVPLEKMRGRKKLLSRMLDLMEERGVDLSNQIIGISHGDNLEMAESFKKEIQKRFHCKEIIITMIGAAIGAHAGPGTIALFFLDEKIPKNYKH
ncbi:DegV family protein [Garciella nitratireducens]|uniref:DegV family protein n=1 Tax=Garciella nitratireducens TaxID=218205 RepID=UPI000DE86927|nr:DegV family protein [Garciella nitratireducens]RBP44815.1 DegV family protein with EDD domain [Garciella nitratireducens]